jgi:hypothetical protein
MDAVIGHRKLKTAKFHAFEHKTQVQVGKRGSFLVRCSIKEKFDFYTEIQNLFIAPPKQSVS